MQPQHREQKHKQQQVVASLVLPPVGAPCARPGRVEMHSEYRQQLQRQPSRRAPAARRVRCVVPPPRLLGAGTTRGSGCATAAACTTNSSSAIKWWRLQLWWYPCAWCGGGWGMEVLDQQVVQTLTALLLEVVVATDARIPTHPGQPQHQQEQQR